MNRPVNVFARFARDVARNAVRYGTKEDCVLMLARVKSEFVRTGSYGCVAGERSAAISALQDRWVELDCVEREQVAPSPVEPGDDLPDAFGTDGDPAAYGE